MALIKRQGSGGRKAMLAVAAGLGVVASGAVIGRAQDSGVVVQFGLNQRLEFTDNLALDPVSAGTTSQASTALSFNISSETGISKLTFGGGATLQVYSAPGEQTQSEIANKRLNLGYSRSAANSSLDLRAAYREDDLRFLRPLTDFTNPDTGEVELPEDLDDLFGTGTRASTSLKAAIRWGEGQPLSYGLTATSNETDYSNTSSTLFDSQRVGLTGEVTARLSPVTSVSLNLGRSRFTDDDPISGTRITTTFGGNLRHERDNGTISIGLSVARTEDGSRESLTFGRNFELAQGTLDVNLGFTRGVSGGTTVTGSLGWQQELPNGALSAAVKRSVGPGADDGERIISTLSLGMSRDLSPLIGLNLGLNYVDSEETATGASVTNADFSASVSYALTSDWSLDMGYTHRLRDTSTGPEASSDTLFLSIGRNFSFRP